VPLFPEKSFSVMRLNPDGWFGHTPCEPPPPPPPLPPELLVATVTSLLALFPSAVTVIVALPLARAVTSPVELTVATEVLLLLQVNVTSEMPFPFASSARAVSRCVSPTVRLAEVGDTVTLDTAAGRDEVGGA